MVTLGTEGSGRHKEVAVDSHKSQWMDFLSAETEKVAFVETRPLAGISFSKQCC